MNYPKPNVLRLLEGDRGHRTKKQKAKSVFPIPTVIPKPPQELDEEANTYWNKYFKLYHITSADILRFLRLCKKNSELKKLEKIIEEQTPFQIRIFVDGSGTEYKELKIHPAKRLLLEEQRDVERMERDFSRRYSGKGEPEDPMEKLLKG